VICTGALSVKNTDPDLYDEIINNHDCESNYDGSSGKLGFVYQKTENKSMLNFFSRRYGITKYSRHIQTFRSKVSSSVHSACTNIKILDKICFIHC